jgi:hypothetical protein
MQSDETGQSLGEVIPMRGCISNGVSRPKSKIAVVWRPGGLSLSGDVRGNNILFEGEQVCAETDTPNETLYANVLGPDVQVFAQNAVPTGPNVGLRQSLDRVTFDRVCFGTRGGSVPVGYEESWDDGVDRVVVQRLPDTSTANISVVVTGTEEPTDSGKVRECPKGDL